MTYIINPAVFYWMDALEDLRMIIAIGFGLCATAALVLTIYIAASGWELDDDDLEKLKKWRRRVYIALPIFALGLVFTPSKTAMTEMLVARFATYENAEWTVDSIKSVVDYIIEAMKSLK